ncbi:MAG: hypothetical protein DWQ36_06085 [Acidobacteria bacterium]|mgnify:CR=1 FL=1|nr:MAG: hypothetical protein DWQ30_19090 [Acidobacteriota bacterium]REK09617.1 MAG: hypothetical protein DWQ36_06085 [Acidobacteriota bacterium]
MLYAASDGMTSPQDAPQSAPESVPESAPEFDSGPLDAFEALLLFLALGVLVFWSFVWSDAAPDDRLVAWVLMRPEMLSATLVAQGLLVALILARVARGSAREEAGRQRLRDGAAGALLRRSGLAVLCLLTAAVVLGAANRVLRLEGDDLLSAKLRQYEQVKDQVDAVFIGSSRIYRHLDPRVFDLVREERVRVGGQPGLSFNLGVPDMRMLEVLYLAEWVFERSDRVELLIVEATDDPLELPEWNRNAERTIAWHDEKAMERIRRGIAQLEAGETRRAELLAAHLEIYQRRSSAVGRGAVLLDREPWPGLPPEQRGYQSLEQNQRHPISEDEAQELVERWNLLHERPGAWNRSLARLEREVDSATTDPFEQELFGELEALAARHGARVLWLVSPGPTRRPDLIAAQEKGIVREVLRFDDPERFPEFYAPSGRFDRHHLSEEMAARFTVLVAEAVVERGLASPAEDPAR